MTRSHRSRWSYHPRRLPTRATLRVEPLEERFLLSAALGALPVVLQTPGHATLDQAQDLGDLTGTGAAVQGAIADATEVDWYALTVSQPADLSLTAVDPASQGHAAVALSLYNSDPFDFSDLYDPLGHRLLAQ